MPKAHENVKLNSTFIKSEKSLESSGKAGG